MEPNPINPLHMKNSTASRIFLNILLLGSTLGLAGLVQGQGICGTMDYLNQQMAADPSRAVRLQQADHHALEYAMEHAHGEARSLVVIPVVVHVVWQNSTENISDARILAMIDQLNLDYAHANSDANETPAAFAGLATNTQIQFCMAQRDPNGNATNGIERKQTNVSTFSTNDKVKHNTTGGMDAWPADSYLNLWICDLSSGLLGYAQFPGGPANTDGVVVDHGTIGGMQTPGIMAQYNWGRIAAHEIGHWMNLRHIWGDDGNACSGTDLVSDTPNQAGPNSNCPNFPHVTCSNGPNGDMYMNYMDYSNDPCRNMFSLGQADRMQSVFSPGGARATILGSMGCVPPSGGCTDNHEPNGTKATADVITVDTDVTALIGVGNDVDWYKFNNTAAQPNIRIDLTDLPANYDLRLIKSGTQLGNSQNTGTADEQITYNGGAVGSYFVRVWGRKGAFDANDCYHLRVTLGSSGFFAGDTRMVPNVAASGPEVLSIHPNPTNGYVVVEYVATQEGTVSFNIFDALGQAVQTSERPVLMGPNSLALDLPSLPDGLYMVRLQQGDHFSTHRVVVSH